MTVDRSCKPSSNVAGIAGELLSARGELLAAAPASAGGGPWLLRHAAAVDCALQAIFALAAAETGLPADGEAAPLALLATGGYGRRELAPYSDIDLAFVPVEEDDPQADALIKATFRRVIEVLMDAARLEVSYAFRPIADLESIDPTTRTALLDARLVAGNPSIAERLHGEMRARIGLADLLQEQAADRRRRQRDPRNSLYALEPDLKNGAGGLRDLQWAIWLLQVRHGTSGDDKLQALADRGLIPAPTAAALGEAREFVWRLRNWLHLTAKRRQDLLSVEYRPRAELDLGGESGAAIRQRDLLEQYYVHAEAIARFLEQVAAELWEGELPVGEGFVARGGRLFALPGALGESHERLLEAAEQGQRCGFELSAELARELASQAPLMDERIRHSRRAATSFLALLSGGDAERWLRRLHGLGVLGRYLPELGAVMRLAPTDPTHVFTVGEHGLRTAGWLAELMARPPSAPDLLAHAAAQVADAEVLVLAGLLHDTGKLAPGEDHSLSGERIARSIGERLGLGRARVETLGLLVREHLLLGRSSRLRDVKDPATIAEVLRGAGDRDTLSMLYLLSQADLRHVSPNTDVSVELHLLDDLYGRALAAASGPPPPTEEVRGAIAKELNGAPQRALQRLLERMPPRYLLNTPLAEIAGHVDLFDRLEREEPVIEAGPVAGGQLTEITICTHDDPEPGLLHKITGVLHGHDLDIHAAHVFTTEEQHPVALDTLWVSRRRAPLAEAQTERVVSDLRAVLSGEVEVGSILAQRGRSPAEALSIVSVGARNDLSDEHTVIEIEAADAPGLLFRLTGALSGAGLDTHAAKISTWGGRAVDAFYVTRRGAGKPADGELAAIESALRAHLAAGR